MSNKIKITNARLSFPSLFQKAKFEGKDTKYSATLLLDKELHVNVINQLKSEIKAILADKFEGKRPKNICLKDGEDVKYAGYSGCYSIKASNVNRFVIIDSDKSPLVEDDHKFYPGCYVNAIVQLWASTSYGGNICANLMGIQFSKDGENLADVESCTSNDFEIVNNDNTAADVSFENEDNLF